MIEGAVITVSNINELYSLDRSTIKPYTIIIVIDPKPSKSFVYYNGEFIRLNISA